jgi:hypothetical protein
VSGSASGSVSVVCVRGVRPGVPVVGGRSLVYVGRSGAGWSGSALGNPFRRVGGVPGSSLPAFRRWLWSVCQSGLAGQSSAAWVALVGLVGRVRAGEQLALGCWCRDSACCHASVVRSCVLWLVGESGSR